MENSTKHRWYEVIVAWASGEEIQFNFKNLGWRDYCCCGGIVEVPGFNNKDTEWRVKHKTVTKKYRMALIKCDAYEGCTCVDVTDSSIDDPIEYNIPGFIRWVGDTVEVEVNCAG